MTNYLDLLKQSYSEMVKWREDSELSKLEFLANDIFGFITYETEISSTMATKALEVCCAISENKTFDYIESEEGNLWYLLMVNMPFFESKLEWGTSIRGAWWDLHGEEKFTLVSCGLCLEGEQIMSINLDKDQWPEFINAMVKFVVEK